MGKHTLKPSILAIVIISFCIGTAFADPSADPSVEPMGIPADNMLDQLIEGFQISSVNLVEPLARAAKSVFYYLLVIDFTWTCILLVLADCEIQEYLIALVKRVLFIGFFLILIDYGPYWARMIVESFSELGKIISSSGKNVGPSDVFETGLKTVCKMMKDARWLTGEIVMVSLLVVIVMGCFSMIAGIMVVTTVEMYLILSAGVILLGFGGSRWTSGYALNYIKYALAIGLKLFGVLLVTNIGFETILYWQDFFRGNQFEQNVMLMGGLIVFLTLVLTIPNILAALVGSNTPNSADNLLKSASYATSLGRTGIMLSKHLGMQGSGAASAASTAIGMARQGNKGFINVASGAMANIGGAIKNQAVNSFKSSRARTIGGGLAKKMGDSNE